MYNGYDFIFDTPFGMFTLPITPPSMSVKIGSNNKVITLINENDVNVLKSPKLAEIEFEARFPMKSYPYTKEVRAFDYYFNIIRQLKEEKKPFRFLVVRRNPKTVSMTWDTNFLVSLETFDMTENADEGDDVLIKFSLKQYKEYGVQVINLPQEAPKSTSTSTVTRDTSKKNAVTETYETKKDDTLFSVSKKKYGTTQYADALYEYNKASIEENAKQKLQKESSSNGHKLAEATTLKIPPTTKLPLGVKTVASTTAGLLK